MLEAHGASKLLISFNDAIPGFIFSGLFFTDKLLKENPETVKAFLRGLVNAFAYIKTNEQKARKWIPKYSNVELPVAMKAAIRYFSNGREPEKQIYKQQALMIKQGYLKELVPVDKFIDYSYLPSKD
ncbi:MAG: hypothetical protein V1753_01835 [Pseudomonadota bacterium]